MADGPEHPGDVIGVRLVAAEEPVGVRLDHGPTLALLGADADHRHLDVVAVHEGQAQLGTLGRVRGIAVGAPGLV